MSDASLLIKVGADTKDAVAGLKQVQQSAEDLSQNSTKLSSNLKSLTDQFNSLSQAEKAGAPGKALADQIDSTSEALDTVNGKLEGFAQAQATSTAATTKAASSVGDLSKVLSVGEEGLQGMTGGFSALGPEVGIATVAISYIVDALKDYNRQEEAATLATQHLNDAVKDQHEIMTLDLADVKRAGELRQSELKAQGASQEELIDGQIESAQREKKVRDEALLDAQLAYDKSFQINEKDNEKRKALQDEAIKNLTAAEEAQKDIVNKIAILGNDKISAEDITPTIKVDTLKATLQAQEEIKRLGDELRKVDTKPLFQQFADSIDDNRADIIRTKIALVIRDNVKNGIAQSITDQEVGLLNDQLKKLQSPDLKFKMPLDIDESTVPDLTKQIKTVTGRLDKGSFLHLQFDRNQAIEDAAKLGKDIGTILQKGIEPGLISVSESIGQALGSGGNVLKAAGESILSTIGDLMEQIGKALLEYGIVKVGLDQIIEGGIAIPGAVALAVGAAAIAAGALVKTLSKPHAFADGGIVTGPVNALIGEAGPEAIFPLSKLNQFVKSTQGGGQVVVLNSKISGNNLLLLQNRTSKNQGLV